MEMIVIKSNKIKKLPMQFITFDVKISNDLIILSTFFSSNSIDHLSNLLN